MYHKIIIAGNLGKDPEMRYTPSGQAVTNFSVATNEQWTDQQNQRQKRTTWWRVSVWGRQAETCNQYLARGAKVLIEGTINVDAQTGGPRTFTRQDGSVGAQLEITARTVRFLSGRDDMGGDDMGGNQGGYGGGNQGYGGGNQGYGGGGGAPAPQTEDDIPF